MLRMDLADANRSVAAFHDVAATGTVYMQVDKARQTQRLARCAGRLFTNGIAVDVVDAPLGCEGNGALHETRWRQNIAADGTHHSRLISATKS